MSYHFTRMTIWKLILRSIIFYWRTNLGVLMGVATGAAVLIGALIVGDSVNGTLKAIAFSRIGKVQLAIAPQDRYFREKLADDMGFEIAAPTLMVYGIAINSDGDARANHVQVFGVDKRFWRLRNDDSNEKGLYTGDIDDNFVIINEHLAKRVGVGVDDEILLRIDKPGSLPRDAPMSVDDDVSTAFRVTVKSVVPDLDIGGFSLQSSQIPPSNAFVSINTLQKKVDLPGRANLLLIGNDSEKPLQVDDSDKMLRERWEIADADLELRNQDMPELRTGRIFLDPTVAKIARQVSSNPIGILTYFVNEIRLGHRMTPYSMISAIEPKGFTDIEDDEIIINEWLADDLQAKPGDSVNISYFVFGNNRRLEERTSSFRVGVVIPIRGLAADRSLMPDFPGISKSENCRDWEPGIPVNLKKIRTKDEEYWDTYHGTPKAFISLSAGQKIWDNRFGNLTAIRYPTVNIKEIESKIKRELDPSSVGLFFQPIRERMIAASNPSTDFGQLFLGLSAFLIATASLLTGLLFVLGIQQRTGEMGILKACGFTSPKIYRLFLLEGSLLAIFGSIIGIGAAVFYTKSILYALSTIWKDVVGTGVLQFHVRPLTIAIGLISNIIISILAIWITSRRYINRSSHELLVSFSAANSSASGNISRPGLIIGSVSILVALFILIGTIGNEIKFFLSGTLLLIGCISFSSFLFKRELEQRKLRFKKFSLIRMGLSNSIRHKWRSIAIIMLLALGSFLIIAIGANRREPMEVQKRSSGTGGFAFYGESTLPVFRDLNSKDGRDLYGLTNSELDSIRFVQFRVHDGDDASCLNLNRAQKPRILGIKPQELQDRFTFIKPVPENGYSILNNSSFFSLNRAMSCLGCLSKKPEVINAIGDQDTIKWGLGMSVGDMLSYTDEHGETFQIRIAGAIASSILQGSLLISEDEFIRRFPSKSGYRVFLVDAPFEGDISKSLTRAFQDVGMELTTSANRMAEFGSVQNTYLSIFQVLGGLALILGCLGLGVVVLSNIMERRGELALMRAVGFEKRSLQFLVSVEHLLLMFLGLACGVISGLVSVIPVFSGSRFPYTSLSLTLFAIALSGMIWILVTTKLALRGNLLGALRNE